MLLCCLESHKKFGSDTHARWRGGKERMLETELLGERICQVDSFARLLRVALAVGGECAGAGCSSLEKSAPQAAPPPFPSVAGERVLGEAPEAWEGMISDFFGGPSRRAGEQGATYGGPNCIPQFLWSWIQPHIRLLSSGLWHRGDKHPQGLMPSNYQANSLSPTPTPGHFLLRVP